MYKVPPINKRVLVVVPLCGYGFADVAAPLTLAIVCRVFRVASGATPGVGVRLGMVSDYQLRLVLFGCRFGSEGLRPAFVPFSAGCVASRLAVLEGISRGQAMRQLWGRAGELGGEVAEDEVVWLPTDRFGELLSGLIVVLAASAEDAALAVFPSGGLVVAADGGAEIALARGLHVDVAVGDFDSISPEGLAALEAAGTRIERHPREKDATDLELALNAARDLRARRVVVIGGGGGRLDHLLGQLLLLGAEAYSEMEIDARFGSALVHVVRGERVFAGVPGELVSLFAVHGPAHGVVSEGLVYPLRKETLEPGSTRGVSNVFAEADAQIVVDSGVVMVVRPSGSVAGGS